MAVYTNSIGQILDLQGLEQIKSYLIQQNELFRYILNNLDPEDNFSADAWQKYMERDNQIAQMVLDADGLKVDMKNLETNTAASLRVLNEQIVLKVSRGEVSSQISVETGGVNITGNRLTWTATNSSMTANGTLICKNIEATNGVFKGTMEAGAFYADDDMIILGDFLIDATSPYTMYGGGFSLTTSDSPNGNGFSVLTLSGTNGSYTMIGGGSIDTTGTITCAAVYADEGDNYNSKFYDILLGKSWWGGWTITRTMQDLWEQVDSLSDETEKMNILDIDADEAAEFILSSRPVSFQYIRDGRWSAGFIAQEVEALQEEKEIYFPLVRTDTKRGKLCLNYNAYIPLIVATLQRLQAQINEMKGA